MGGFYRTTKSIVGLISVEYNADERIKVEDRDYFPGCQRFKPFGTGKRR
jgi:hypothetical protein